MSWNYATDPVYRWLCDEAADLEWQCVEEECQSTLQRAEHASAPAIDEARQAVDLMLLGRR